MMHGLRCERLSDPIGSLRLPAAATVPPPPPPTLSINIAVESPDKRVWRLISENPVVIFSRAACCLCHVVKRLLATLGVHPTVVELDDKEAEAATVLFGGVPLGQMAPAVFIGGSLVGGVESLMALHLSGQLVPKLSEAGAAWM
ncbi:glutaredoxin-C1-like [Nymphaea colorata]|uniref:Glutaredoxin domain-containing protein n=1 Tax=Nymphaea colorata TaxID=210225 RepID=A0A5K0VTU7_9MAGN|nr:glutaredoxin-C1-like [Nymphaea colorata]